MWNVWCEWIVIIVCVFSCIFRLDKFKQSTVSALLETNVANGTSNQTKISYFSSIKKSMNEIDELVYMYKTYTHSILLFGTCNFPPKFRRLKFELPEHNTTWITGYLCWNAKLIWVELCVCVSVYLSCIYSTLEIARSTIVRYWCGGSKRKQCTMFGIGRWRRTKPEMKIKTSIICMLNTNQPRQYIVFRVFLLSSRTKAKLALWQYNKFHKCFVLGRSVNTSSPLPIKCSTAEQIGRRKKIVVCIDLPHGVIEIGEATNWLDPLTVCVYCAFPNWKLMLSSSPYTHISKAQKMPSKINKQTPTNKGGQRQELKRLSASCIVKIKCIYQTNKLLTCSEKKIETSAIHSLRMCMSCVKSREKNERKIQTWWNNHKTAQSTKNMMEHAIYIDRNERTIVEKRICNIVDKRNLKYSKIKIVGLCDHKMIQAHNQFYRKPNGRYLCGHSVNGESSENIHKAPYNNRIAVIYVESHVCSLNNWNYHTNEWIFDRVTFYMFVLVVP